MPLSLRPATVILVDDMTASADGGDAHLHGLRHRVIALERLTLDCVAAAAAEHHAAPAIA